MVEAQIKKFCEALEVDADAHKEAEGTYCCSKAEKFLTLPASVRNWSRKLLVGQCAVVVAAWTMSISDGTSLLHNIRIVLICTEPKVIQCENIALLGYR